MRTIPLTRGLVALVDDADHEAVVAAGPWYPIRDGLTIYAERNAPRDGGGWKSQRLHRFLTDHPMTDHANGDGLDNRRENLRTATKSQNSANRGLFQNSTSGFKGVSWNKHARGWQAYITAQAKRRHLGYHDTPEAAARAYDAAARELFGEFARLNFPGVTA